MQQIKRPLKSVPSHINENSKLAKKQHIANLTTQIFCTLIATYSDPFTLRQEQIDTLIKTAYKLARHINEMTD
jgi:hypothetical protein